MWVWARWRNSGGGLEAVESANRLPLFTPLAPPAGISPSLPRGAQVVGRRWGGRQGETGGGREGLERANRWPVASVVHKGRVARWLCVWAS